MIIVVLCNCNNQEMKTCRKCLWRVRQELRLKNSKMMEGVLAR